MNENEWACGKDDDWRSIRGMGWRIAFSATSALVWFGFIIGWLFFLADDYSILQNIGVLLLSVVALGAVNAPIWILFAKNMEEVHDLRYETKGHGMFKGVAGLIWVMAFGIWLFFYAGNYSLYQNLAVLMLSLVPLGAIGLFLKH